MMQVDVQQRRLGRLDAFAQSVLDVGEIVDALGAPKVDDKMRSGETLAVALNKEVLALLVSDESGGVLFFRFGGAWVVVKSIHSWKREIGRASCRERVCQYV